MGLMSTEDPRMEELDRLEPSEEVCRGLLLLGRCRCISTAGGAVGTRERRCRRDRGGGGRGSLLLHSERMEDVGEGASACARGRFYTNRHAARGEASLLPMLGVLVLLNVLVVEELAALVLMLVLVLVLMLVLVLVMLLLILLLLVVGV